jgi:hypothetical protein
VIGPPGGEGELERQQRQQQEDRQADVLVGDDGVDAIGDGVAGIGLLVDRLGASPGDEAVAAVGEDDLGLVAADAADVVAGAFGGGQEFVGRLGAGFPEAAGGLLIGFEQLDGRPAGQGGLAGRPADLLGEGLDLRLQLPSVARPALGGDLRGGVFADAHGLGDQRLDPLPPVADRLHDRCPQQLREHAAVDLQAPVGGQVRLVERQQQRGPQLQQLRGEVQVPFEVRGVHDVDDHVGLPLHNELAGDDLFLRVGGQAVRARQVDDLHVPVAVADEAGLDLDGDAGIVAHVLAGAGEGVEQGRLAGVGIAGEGDGQSLAVGGSHKGSSAATPAGRESC